ncbi:hypothetical protein J3E69DRAFT_256475 [Trichoderma sp. SZMC 28015]
MRLIHCLCLCQCLTFVPSFPSFSRPFPWRHGDRLADVEKKGQRPMDWTIVRLSLARHRGWLELDSATARYTMIPDRGSARYCWVFFCCFA